MTRLWNSGRRAVLGGMAAAVFAPHEKSRAEAAPAVTWTDQPAFATGPLAGDLMARLFKAPAGEAAR